MKLAANLTMLFTEAGGLLERYEAAALAGFRYVECAFPYAVPIDRLSAEVRRLGLRQVLINAPVGTSSAESKGYACLPGYKEQFKESLNLALQYAKALDCPRIHIMAGLAKDDVSKEELEKTYLDNLRYAEQQLSKANIVGLIEPINQITIPGYFLNDFDQAERYLNLLSSKFIRLQLDVFHLQMSRGCLTHHISRLFSFIDHIQIAQAPNRHEPTSTGEINYGYVFDLLRTLQYNQFIGLEYNPANGTAKGLDWIKALNLAEQML